MTKLPRNPTRSALALLLLPALAACGGGGGSDDDQVASLGNGDEPASEEEDPGGGDAELSDAEREDAMLEFTECMREHGVDIPDPTSAGVGDVVISGSGPATETRGEDMPDEFREAEEACGGLLEDAFGAPEDLSPEEEAEMQDNMLAFAACMRENGIDMPDPEVGGKGGDVAIGMGGAGMDPSDPEFKAAEEECSPELGFEPGADGGAHSGSVTVEAP